MTVHYDVQISGVREVSLIGTATAPPWRQRLAEYDLHPSLNDGQAEIMLSGCEGRFKGIRFRELSISVMVSNHAEGASRDGAFLVQAFNSLRFFAWVERTMFHTPYHFAGIQVETGPPASVELKLGSQSALAIAMEADPGPQGSGIVNRTPLTVAEDGWAGPIHLPRRNQQSSEPLRLFHGKLAGLTHTYDFTPADRFTLHPAAKAPVIQWLIDSNFRPRQWIIRPDATHGKSKTIRRSL